MLLEKCIGSEKRQVIKIETDPEDEGQGSFQNVTVQKLHLDEDMKNDTEKGLLKEAR